MSNDTAEQILRLIEEMNAEIDRLELQFELLVSAVKVALEIARESGMEGDAMYFLSVLDTIEASEESDDGTEGAAR